MAVIGNCHSIAGPQYDFDSITRFWAYHARRRKGGRLSGRPSRQDVRLRPMLATSSTELPEGPQWTYEVKWDGYRALAMKDGSKVRLISRNQKDLTRDYPTVVGAIQTVRQGSMILDGEIVALD